MIIRTADEMSLVADHLLSCLEKERTSSSGATVLLISGDLGAGKTTFVQSLAGMLGVKERVTSPTFVIQKEYETSGWGFARLVHIDAYRLNSFSDLELLGWGDFINDPETLVALEWPERVTPLTGGEQIRLQFSHLASGEREVLFAGEGTIC